MATAPGLLFPWSDAYSVKIGFIDSQHKVLVDLINQLHQAMITRTGKERLGKILAPDVGYEALQGSTQIPPSTPLVTPPGTPATTPLVAPPGTPPTTPATTPPAT